MWFNEDLSVGPYGLRSRLLPFLAEWSRILPLSLSLSKVINKMWMQNNALWGHSKSYGLSYTWSQFREITAIIIKYSFSLLWHVFTTICLLFSPPTCSPPTPSSLPQQLAPSPPPSASHKTRSLPWFPSFFHSPMTNTIADYIDVASQKYLTSAVSFITAAITLVPSTISLVWVSKMTSKQVFLFPIWPLQSILHTASSDLFKM